VLRRIFSRKTSERQTTVYPRSDEDETRSSKILDGKGALITAAGRNIGEAIAIEFALQGANVFCTDLDESRLVKLREALSAFPVKSICVQSDILDVDKARGLSDKAWASLGQIDILVNNVGIKIKSKFVGNENLENEWYRTFQTNVFGPLALTRHLCDRMIVERVAGNVIFISSIHGSSVLGRAHYSASKAAVEMASRELAIELAPHGIRVNAVAPGYVDVDSSGHTVSHPVTPLGGHAIHPKFVGRAAASLASDYLSGMTTGAVLTVDAGLSLVNYLDLRPRNQR
jgi:NAD(P)-dependent dehydrogenase (short-subunit alcohol dehydrogenase family)